MEAKKFFQRFVGWNVILAPTGIMFARSLHHWFDWLLAIYIAQQTVSGLSFIISECFGKRIKDGGVWADLYKAGGDRAAIVYLASPWVVSIRAVFVWVIFPLGRSVIALPGWIGRSLLSVIRLVYTSLFDTLAEDLWMLATGMPVPKKGHSELAASGSPNGSGEELVGTDR